MPEFATHSSTELKSLLVAQLQDLVNSEKQIIDALPGVIEAAESPLLKEALNKHLLQTQTHSERLVGALEMLGSGSRSEPCTGMQGILEEGEETITRVKDKDRTTADLALIGAAQKVEHYEISAYGTAKCLAKQIGEHDVARTLSHILGEEEAADFLLTTITKPLLEQATSREYGNGTKMPWGEPGDGSIAAGTKTSSDAQTGPLSFAARVGSSAQSSSASSQKRGSEQSRNSGKSSDSSSKSRKGRS